jgi:beta-lactam-binding protein with PASTA domain
VPALRGKTLKAASRALVRAHCRAGKVTRKRSRRVRAGRVISTSPPAHTRHASGTKVKIRLSRGH